jgi:uncharacterized membrane protein
MKTLHVLFVIVFMGNIIVSIFWKMFADKTGNQLIIAFTLKSIIRNDRFLTMPGVIGLIIFGFGAQGIGHIPITAGWILWPIILVVISGAAFMAKVVPVQKKLLKLAESGSFNKSEYEALSKEWTIWGMIATLTPLAAAIIMVLKIPQ